MQGRFSIKQFFKTYIQKIYTTSTTTGLLLYYLLEQWKACIQIIQVFIGHLFAKYQKYKNGIQHSWY